MDSFGAKETSLVSFSYEFQFCWKDIPALKSERGGQTFIAWESRAGTALSTEPIVQIYSAVIREPKAVEGISLRRPLDICLCPFEFTNLSAKI